MFLLSVSLFFVLGFFLLIKGSDFLVQGATAIARQCNISEWVVGALILGIGTSIPEFAVMLTSVLSGNDVGLGTIIGSNTFNILFIIGAAACVVPLAIKKEWIAREVPTNLIAIVMMGLFLWFPLVGNTTGISRGEGLLLLCGGAVWVYMLMRQKPRVHIERLLPDEKEMGSLSSTRIVFFLLLGFITVILGSTWVVDGAIAYARIFGVSESLIGLTLVSIGSSVPELFVTLSAARKGKAGLAVGNIIGSNIFNFLGIFAFVSLIMPITFFDPHIWFDIAITICATLIFYMVIIFGKGLRISRGEGVLLIILYGIYLWITLLQI